MRNVDLFRDYENGKMISAREYRDMAADRTYCYDELPEKDVDGIPVCVMRNAAGKLETTFVADTHLLAIGATRSGKTTGYVIPTMNILLKKRNKPSLVISDPKGELYEKQAGKFYANGYRVILLDFINYRRGDCWNPLTKYYRLYQKYLKVGDEVSVVNTPQGWRNSFRGVIYNNQAELDMAIAEAGQEYLDETEKGISEISELICPTRNTRDPFWEDSARLLISAILYGMLEDSAKGIITENNFSFDTMLRISDSFTDKENNYDGGFFSKRDIKTSKARQLAQKCILEQAPTTRRCISSSFATRMSIFRDTAVRRVTCTNTFEMKDLDNGEPTVIFLSYKDEESLHYEVISMFLSNLYKELIAISRRKGTKLERPFYFLLDEFGNLPKFADFDKVISACGGRNIWFLLVLQSYAQLINVYGEQTAQIIKDNLNMHLFFGTNNPETKRAFSDECGKKTVISPISALSGTGESVSAFGTDTVPVVPVSTLNHIEPGCFIMTQMCGDVVASQIERSYICPEFLQNFVPMPETTGKVAFADAKYYYNPATQNDDDNDDDDDEDLF